MKDSTRLRISLAATGRKLFEETKDKIRAAHVGTHHTQATKEKMSLSRSGVNHHYYGKQFSQEYRNKLSVGHLGQVAWNKGLTVLTDPRIAAVAKKIGDAHRGIKLSPQAIKNILRRRPISDFEQRFIDFVAKYNLPYRFVGRGEVILDGLNPDFINTDGQKILVEVYWSRHKLKGFKSLKEFETYRSNRFGKLGFRTIYFNEFDFDRVDWEQHFLSKLEVSHFIF